MRKSFVAAGIAVACTSVLVGGVAHASPTADVLDADGYHGLKLGMSDAGALSTNQLGPLDRSDQWCNRYRTVDRPADGRSVAISHKFGVVILRVPDSVRTPEGIGTGSTVAQLKAAYPGATDYRYGFAIPVPGYADRFYDFWVDSNQMPYPDSAKVIQLGLDSYSSDCVG